MAVGELAGRDPLVVAGIDPGSQRMGYGVVGREGRRLLAVDHGVFTLARSAGRATRLHELFQGVGRLLAHHRPDAVSLEQAFYHRNIQSALRLGEVRATVMVAAAAAGVPVVEYPTAVAKKAVTGHGGASKERVRDLVAAQLAMASPPEPHDAADALALALCLLHDPRLDPAFARALGAGGGRESLKDQS